MSNLSETDVREIQLDVIVDVTRRYTVPVEIDMDDWAKWLDERDNSDSDFEFSDDLGSGGSPSEFKVYLETHLKSGVLESLTESRAGKVVLVEIFDADAA